MAQIKSYFPKVVEIPTTKSMAIISYFHSGMSIL